MTNQKILARLKSKLFRRASVQKLLTPLGFELNPRRWIFIVGCYNSGTSLLQEILKSHRKIQGLPIEGVFLTDALPCPEEYGWNRMWVECLDDMRLEPGPEAKRRASRIKKQWSFHYPSRRSASLLEKSVSNTARLIFLQDNFSPAYFIYIVRDGYAVAEGIQRKAQPGLWGNPEYDDSYPISLCAKQWRKTDEIVQGDRQRIDRLLQVHYENLTRNPERTVRKITDFLGLSPLPIQVLQGQWGSYGEPIRNMNPRSHRRLSDEDIDTIEEVAEPVLAKYGYCRP